MTDNIAHAGGATRDEVTGRFGIRYEDANSLDVVREMGATAWTPRGRGERS